MMSNRAIVFAGQGAQFVGMGKDLADAYPECKALFEKADEVLGFKISDICFEGPEEELTKSNNCQPAIFAASIACYKALCLKAGGDISLVGTAGLSLGEWSALHMAGAMSFEDTLKVLEARGRFMQEACDENESGMISIIGLPMDKLKEICDKTGVYIANMNSEAQTVLSGLKQGIEDAEKLASEAGAKRAIVLNVAGAFHSPLMQSAADRLREVLADIDISKPTMPVVANVTGMPHGEPDEIRETMLKQITESVRWFEGIQWFMANGVTEYTECGPGKVLSGLIKRIDKGSSINNIQDIATLEKTTA
jgi:[acyl-carrier-protein] S-malonyltransferase